MSGAGPRPPRVAEPLSREKLLAQVLELRSKISEALSRAQPGAPAPAAPLTRENLLKAAYAVYTQTLRAQETAERIAEARPQVELLARANELLQTIEVTRDRYERAISIAARQLLLRELEALKKQAASTLARVRLLPDVFTA